MNYVLDTHTLIWYFIGSKRLKRNAKRTIDECLHQGGRLLIPTIVLSEALAIAEKQKLEFDFTAMYRLIKEEPSFAIIGFSPEIFEATVKLKGIKEIHDRIISATARFYAAAVITQDRIIKASGEAVTL